MIVTVNNVEKYFAKVKAVNKLSFHIRESEIFALLGPNGAGKTTMVRMLLNIIRPDNGVIHYHFTNGRLPDTAAIGYLPEERGLYQDIPVLKTLTYFGVIRGIERHHAKRLAEEWLARLGIQDRMNEKVQSLSKGNQQKVQFIASILHKPRIAVLDEPFSGFDPINQDLIAGIIRELCNNGTTILLSAHQMQLVERIADRILLIDKGREVLTGTFDEIRKAAGAGNKVTVQLEDRADPAPLYNHPAIQSIEPVDTLKLVIYTQPDGDISDLLRTLGTYYKVKSIHSDYMSLHDIYVHAIGNKA